MADADKPIGITPTLNLKPNPWGSRERAAEMTILIADTRYAGPSSIFYSISPDDVHYPTSIRWAIPQ
jgi:hypothetical protein